MRYIFQRFIDRYLGIPLVVLFASFKKIINVFRPKLLTVTSPRISSILIIKLTMMGDTVLMEPSIRAIRQKFPSAKMVFLCSPVNEMVVRNWGLIDEVVVFDFRYFFVRPWKIMNFAKKFLHAERFDIAVDYEQWFRITPLLAFLSGARLTAGFKTDKQARDFLFDKKITHSRIAHEVKSFAELTSEVLGIEVRDLVPRINIPYENRSKAQEILKAAGIGAEDKYAIIHPGCGSNGVLREWPPERYAAVADYLYNHYSYRVILTGSDEDKKKCLAVASLMKSPSVDLSGKTDFLTLTSLLSKAQMLVCGNTGVVHIASATSTPSVVIHGPTNHLKWGPLAPCSVSVRSSESCYPCLYLGYEYGCREKRCLKSISVGEVIEAIDKVVVCTAKK